MNGYVPKQLKHVKDRRDYSVLFPMYHIKANSALSCLHFCIKDRDKDNPRGNHRAGSSERVVEF